MGDPDALEQLPYGWFPAERSQGDSYRWAGREAAALIRLERPAKRLRLLYAHVPVDLGGIDMSIRRLGSADPLARVWTTKLRWQDIERSVENHPLALPAGDYEVVFAAHATWSDPPVENRELAFALSTMSLEESYELAAGDLDMADPAADEQLVCGWFGAEPLGERIFRWSGQHAALLVRLPEGARGMRLSYCLPPATIGGVRLSVRALHRDRAAWSTHVRWQDGDWHEDRFAVPLDPGDYMVCFDADATWSNPEGRDRALSPENRSLGMAVSSVEFGDEPEPSSLS
jgi:hypothetical protein